MELFKLHVFSAFFNCNCILYCKNIIERECIKMKPLKTKKY